MCKMGITKTPTHHQFTVTTPGFPPLFITVCEQELLRDDAYRVAAAARAVGVEVSLLARDDLLHVWPIFVPFLPEAREDLEKVVRFIGAH
jgi:monoterpene epsilon-lactone hydrolase